MNEWMNKRNEELTCMRACAYMHVQQHTYLVNAFMFMRMYVCFYTQVFIC